MTTPPPERRLVDKLRRGPIPTRHDFALLIIPAIYGVAATIFYLYPIDVYLLLGGASVVAWGVIANLLFFHPP
ncbi:hypothetical protein [Salinirarus marinus]|uniref:hypothetical protein n=1 Tax=Salinirarus marinus TaxID=3068310 RepID=UPI003C6BFA96